VSATGGAGGPGAAAGSSPSGLGVVDTNPVYLAGSTAFRGGTGGSAGGSVTFGATTKTTQGDVVGALMNGQPTIAIPAPVSTLSELALITLSGFFVTSALWLMRRRPSFERAA
jgi:hypothetical protein